MAIVKVNYTRIRVAIKASVRYITHRRGQAQGITVTRPLFGRDGELSKNQAYNLIDRARRGTVFFRIVISPDPTREDTQKDLNLRDLTLDTLLSLQERLKREIHFIAAEHADHSPARHIHCIALIRGRLSAADFKLLRTAATPAAHLQRQERDLALGRDRGVTQEQSTRPFAHASFYRPYRSVAPKPFFMRAPHCPRCFLGPRMHRLRLTLYRCPNCELLIEQSFIGFRSQEAGWEL